MPDLIQQVVKILDLENDKTDTFIGHSPNKDDHRVFGGQAVAQSIVAANRTIEDKVIHSIKSDFLRAGDPKIPIQYKVERLRDGRSFSTRRVNAIQNDKVIFTLSASYQVPEEGLSHQMDMEKIPFPEQLPTPAEQWLKIKDKLPEHAKQWYEGERPVEERQVEWIDPVDPEIKEPKHIVWHRSNGQLPDDPQLHQAIFAYISDMALLDTCILPHGVSWMADNFQGASLDHCIWFHKPFRVDDWFVTVQDSPASNGARGFNRGLVYTREGVLVASTAQEGLIRIRKS